MVWESRISSSAAFTLNSITLFHRVLPEPFLIFYVLTTIIKAGCLGALKIVFSRFLLEHVIMIVLDPLFEEKRTLYSIRKTFYMKKMSTII